MGALCPGHERPNTFRFVSLDVGAGQFDRQSRVHTAPEGYTNAVTEAERHTVRRAQHIPQKIHLFDAG
jgi:hypothetical protein